MEERPDTDANPYRAPDSSLIDERRRGESDLPRQLAYQSTWVLLIASIVTYGIYAAHYAQRQSHVINRQLPEEQGISNVLVVLLLLTSYLSAILFVPYLLADDDDPIVLISALVDMLTTVLMLIWGFSARSRLNGLLRARPGDSNWFNGPLTFLFTPFYFNYRINVLAQRAAPPPAVSAES